MQRHCYRHLWTFSPDARIKMCIIFGIFARKWITRWVYGANETPLRVVNADSIAQNAWKPEPVHVYSTARFLDQVLLLGVAGQHELGAIWHSVDRRIQFPYRASSHIFSSTIAILLCFFANSLYLSCNSRSRDHFYIIKLCVLFRANFCCVQMKFLHRLPNVVGWTEYASQTEPKRAKQKFIQ